MSDKHYWVWDKETKVVDHKALKAQCRAGQYHIPRSALKVEPKPKKDGFKVIVVLDKDFPIGTEYIEDHVGKMIFDKSDCTKFKLVEKLGAIPDGWTLYEPKTRQDEWIDGKWITNLQNQYEAEIVIVSDARESLYKEQVDRLRNHATSIRRIEKDEEKASEYEAQADAAYLKIKEDNPWPENPHSKS